MMKAPKALVLGSLILMSVMYACKKNDSAPVPGKTNMKWSGETMRVKLKLSGDLKVEESPLGRLESNARLNMDSIIYTVDVRWPNRDPYAQGVFNSLDSLTLDLPKGTSFNIRVAAIKKGSSMGLYESFDKVRQLPFLPGQYVWRYIDNRLSTDTAWPFGTTKFFMDSLSYFPIVNSTLYFESNRNSEVDTYYGVYQGNPTDSQLTSITIPLKRVTYGIRFKAANFNDGTLHVNYGYLSEPKTMTVSNLKDSVYIYTAQEYTYGEDLLEGLPVVLSWQGSDGSYHSWDSITLHPKRNTLTTVSLSLPDKGLPLRIGITENNWNTDTTVVVK